MLQTLKFVANICGGFKQQKTFPSAGKQIPSSVVSAPPVRLAPRCRNSWTEKPAGLHVFQTGGTAYFLAGRKKRVCENKGAWPALGLALGQPALHGNSRLQFAAIGHDLFAL